MTKIIQSARLELLPTEILYSIVKFLPSCVSKRMRDVCLPSLFRKVRIEFSNDGFDKLERLLQSHLCLYIVSFQYVVPELLKPEIRDYAIFKTEILTPETYVEVCEGWDDVNGREDWDELEYLGGSHPSYTLVYKTLRRTCAEQQRIIESGRDSALISLALKRLPNLNELVLEFCGTPGDEDWEKDYLELNMTMQEKSYEYLILID